MHCASQDDDIFAGFCNTCAPDANSSLQNALQDMDGSTILHMDGTARVCGQWYGRSVKAVVVTMACYGVPEGDSRRGASPLPMAVALLTKADAACLTDVVNDVHNRLAQRYGGKEGKQCRLLTFGALSLVLPQVHECIN